MLGKIMVEIIYPAQNLNGSTVQILELLNIFITHCIWVYFYIHTRIKTNPCDLVKHVDSSCAMIFHIRPGT